MKPNALTRDELLDALKPLGNYPVVWSGQTGLVKDAVGSVVVVHHGDTPLISLEPARVQSNVGDVPTTADVARAREDLRVVKNQFAKFFELYLAGEITKRDFAPIKTDYDAAIDRVIEVLNKF